MGPFGHIYLPVSLDPADQERIARHLVTASGIPLVLFKNEHTGKVTAVNRQGAFDLTRDKAAVLGNDHYFLEETAADLKRVCFHRNAGDLIISGWSTDQIPLSFSIENGAHGGPGKEETRGFVLLPRMIDEKKSFVRPLDLRHIIFSLMQKQTDR